MRMFQCRACGYVADPHNRDEAPCCDGGRCPECDGSLREFTHKEQVRWRIEMIVSWMVLGALGLFIASGICLLVVRVLSKMMKDLLT